MFENKRLQLSINYNDLKDQLDIVPVAESIDKSENLYDVIYYVGLDVFHTGF